MFKLKLYIKTQTFGDVLSESDLKAVQAGLLALVLIRALALPRVITDRKVAVNFGAVSISMTEAFAPFSTGLPKFPGGKGAPHNALAPSLITCSNGILGY